VLMQASCNVNHRDSFEMSPLLHATKLVSDDVMAKWNLRFKCSCTVSVGCCLNPPPTSLPIQNNVRAVSLLLEHTLIHIDATDKAGWSAPHWAVRLSAETVDIGQTQPLQNVTGCAFSHVRLTRVSIRFLLVSRPHPAALIVSALCLRTRHA
jgi:hypothetical protein